MLSEALDIVIESRGNAVLLTLSGPFHREQIPNIRAKIERLIRDGTREIIVNLENITVMHESVAPMFLSLLNLIRGKKGDIKLIFKNAAVTKVFFPYQNFFSIYPDYKSLESLGIFHHLRSRGIFLNKKTGIRLSVPVALFLLFILIGWFLSLGMIINMQKKQIIEQEIEIQSFQEWKRKAELEIKALKSRIKPMEQLGLITDSIADE